MAKFNGNEVKLYAKISGGGADVFNVEYGATPFADIKSAVIAGKVCVMDIDSERYYMAGIKIDMDSEGNYKEHIYFYHTTLIGAEGNVEFWEVTVSADNVYSDPTQV